jgi:hypothetical protein
MAYAPTLTPSYDANPSPRVLVSFTSLAGGAQTINVYRVAEGRQFQVRGGVNLFAVGGVAVMDYEAPFGVSMTYRAEMFDSSGNSLGFTDSTTLTIPATSVLGDSSRVWIHQPLKPTLAVQCYMQLGTAEDLVKTNPGTVYWPEGASVGIRVGARRQGVTGMPLVLQMDSAADADEFQSMFGDYSSDFPAVVCIRSAPPVRVPRTLFASGDPDEQTDYISGTWGFKLQVDEVAPPAPGLIIPILRRADIDAAFATRAARAAAYATRLARDTDYSKAGLAG